MDQLQLVTIPTTQLFELINQSLKEQIKKLKQDLSEKLNETLLTRPETAQLLKISTSTLSKWTSDGTLTSHGIGGRVYYKRSEIDKALIKLT
tara:strand:+ start:54688 stop:54963 length:276 start_codon:yes stop_codon:yes gene_type:complete